MDIPIKTPIKIPIINENNIFTPSFFDMYHTINMRYYVHGVGVVVIYIDVLLFTNILIDYCILSLTKKFLHINSKEFRTILGSVAGALFSLTIFLPNVNTFLSLLIKIICSITMCLIAFGYSNIKLFIKNIASVFLFTIVFCGVLTAFYQIAKPAKMAIVNDNVYFQIDSVLLIVISLAIYIIIVLLQRIVGGNISDALVNLNVTIENREYACIGKIDTGCTLTEPFSNAPVIIVEKDLLDGVSDKKERVIPYKVLGRSGIIYAVKAQKVSIDRKEIRKDIYIGMFDGNIDPCFKAIINHNILR